VSIAQYQRALDVGQSHWSASDLDPAKCPKWVQLGSRTTLSASQLYREQQTFMGRNTLNEADPVAGRRAGSSHLPRPHCSVLACS